jgi:hypothetical protein
MQITKLIITLHQQPYDCTNNMGDYNYKHLSIFINMTIKLYNRTHYLRITGNNQRRKRNAGRINPKREQLKQISFKRMYDDHNEKH